MAENLNLNINVGGNAAESVGSLKAQLRSATAEVAILSEKFGATSIEAANAAKRAAELRDRIGDAQLLTQAFNPDAKFRSLTASLSGVAGGFSAVQGAIGLFGIESKEVEKQLLKVQSALALSQGLQSIGESIDAFRTLKTVIMVDVIPAIKALGTAAQVGIGLIIAGVSAAIFAWMDYIDTQEKVKKAQEETNKAIEKGAKSQLEGNIDALEREQKLELARLQGKKNNEQEVFDTEQQFRRLRISALDRYYEEIKDKDIEEGIRIQNQIKGLQVEIQVAEIMHQNKLIQIRADAAEKERLRLKKLQDDDAKAASNAMKLELQALENKSQAAKEQAAADDAYLAEQFAKEDALQAQKIDNTNKRVLREKQAAEDLKAAEQGLYEARWAFAGATVQLFASLAGENEKAANAFFILDKALAVAKIVIDTQKEIAGYAANPFWSALPDGGAAIKSANIVAAKVRAATSIASIAALTIAKFKNGSTAGFGGGTGTLGVSAPIQAQLPTANLTQLNQATINALGNQAVRAYVIETDMTTNQQRIQAIRQRARFG
jgi:hypothetical protein